MARTCLFRNLELVKGQTLVIRRGMSSLGWMLAREGYAMNHKRLYRPYREEGLTVRQRGPRERAVGNPRTDTAAARHQPTLSLDFVSDTLCDGCRFRIICIVDDLSYECLATVVDTSLSGVRVVREMERLGAERAMPQVVVSDDRTEITSGALLRWATGRLAWHYIERGEPVQNASSRASTVGRKMNASTSTSSSV